MRPLAAITLTSAPAGSALATGYGDNHGCSPGGYKWRCGGYGGDCWADDEHHGAEITKYCKGYYGGGGGYPVTETKRGVLISTMTNIPPMRSTTTIPSHNEYPSYDNHDEYPSYEHDSGYGGGLIDIVDDLLPIKKAKCTYDEYPSYDDQHDEYPSYDDHGDEYPSNDHEEHHWSDYLLWNWFKNHKSSKRSTSTPFLGAASAAVPCLNLGAWSPKNIIDACKCKGVEPSKTVYVTDHKYVYATET
ncbi:hypothetical protein Micbo1qcDRAFT_180816 [Microdochium bolleyi]|uniref:CBM1 domain-containing protein n=1 Tax=Microdochium bolleyi TaxID=196109 RepID=A0A136IKE4_9PEZI|nr:hypothetical protein Micbo1qcDRAFT_180816 [Microdochium bolleyi]